MASRGGCGNVEEIPYKSIFPNFLTGFYLLTKFETSQALGTLRAGERTPLGRRGSFLQSDQVSGTVIGTYTPTDSSYYGKPLIFNEMY